MTELPTGNDLNEGLLVCIETKKDQGTGRLTTGAVKKILTTSKYRPHGIKVRLEDGQVGWVKKIINSAAEERVHSFIDSNT